MDPKQLRPAMLAAAMACGLAAQPLAPVFKSDTALQSIAVQVTDRQGNYLHGLTAADFRLREDGHPQKIAFFAAEHEPASLAVLLSTGRTMDFGGKLDRAFALLAPVIQRAHPDDEIFFMPFAEQPGPFLQITDAERSKPPVIGRLGNRGSALYDALATALCRMRNARHVRQAVVVVTDGMDQDSRLKLEEVLELVRFSNAQVFMIGLFDPPAYKIYSLGQKKIALMGLREVDNPLLVFRRFARESGAESFFPSSERDLKSTLDRLAAILAAEYTLAYYPASTGKLRKIEVEVKRPGTRVLARSSVGSDAGSGTVHFAVDSCAVSPTRHPYPWESRVSRSASGLTYHEDFSDPHSGWPNSDAANSDAHYLPGGYQLSRSVRVTRTLFPAVEGEISNMGEALISAYGPWWTDFRASAVVEAHLEPWWKNRRESDMPGAIGSRGGFVFRLMERGYYAFVLTEDARGNGTVAELIRGNWDGTRSVLMPAVQIDSAQLETKTRHTLSVECRGGQIALEIDGRRVGEVRDNTFPFGLVGFGVFGRGRLVVRDLLVEGRRG